MAVEGTTELHTTKLDDDQDDRHEPDLPTMWILRPSIVLLGVGAALIALSALVQLLGNHSGGGSLKNYYYANATIEALAYGCVTAGFFVSWIYSGRSRVTRSFSVAFMLAFLGAACVTTQWVCNFIVYVLDFTTVPGPSAPARAAEVSHLVDATALLQFAGWGAIAGAILLSFFALVARARRPASSDDLLEAASRPTS